MNNTMKHHTNRTRRPNTYALLVCSEDKEQSVSETFVYLLLAVCAAFSIWFAAQQPVRLPLGAVVQTTHAAAVGTHLG